MSQHCGPSTLSSSPPFLKPKSSLKIVQDSIKQPVQYSVFFCKDDKTLVEIKISESVNTIRDMIEVTLSELSLHHKIDLSRNPDLYKIYAAKKSGKKKSDLPCLDSSQKVQKTKINFFSLQRKQTVMMQMNPEQNSSLARFSKVSSGKKSKELMVSGYDPLSSKKIPSTKEIAPTKSIGCFCWSSNKK